MATTTESGRLPETRTALARAELKRQWAPVRRPLLLAAAGVCAGVGAALTITAVRDIPLEDLTRDIQIIANVPFYAGLLSTIGIMVWSAAAAVWLFVLALLRRVAPRHDLAPLALAAGALTLVLLVDDAFMLHETLLPEVLGVPELLVMGGYVALGLGFVLFAWRRVARTSYLPALLAGLFLGLSFGIDLVLPSSSLETLIEDGLKFAGIVFWLAYAATVAGQVVDDLRA
jgi:hypothetical protein